MGFRKPVPSSVSSSQYRDSFFLGGGASCHVLFDFKFYVKNSVFTI